MADKEDFKTQMQELTDRLENGIHDLFESEKYKSYLQTMSKFSSYSTRNVRLIHMQMPNASKVAGFRAWDEKFGRHVNKGEKGIRIYAPIGNKQKEQRQKLDPDTNIPIFTSEGTPVMEGGETTRPMFRLIPVFDVSQTDGRPLPVLAEDLTGNVAQYDAFMAALSAVSPFPISFEALPSDTDGKCRYESRTIALRTGMSETQTVSAAIHEMTHALLHERAVEMPIAEGASQKTKSRETEEVEAESVSYAVCQYYGIETGANSFGYVANWSESMELPELKSSLDTIRKAAAELISNIDARFRDICVERDIDLTAEASIPKQVAPAPEIPTVSDAPTATTTSPDPVQSKNTTAHKNFRALSDLAGELIDGKYDYMCFQAGESFMPLTFEHLYDNRYALMHFYMQNGDMMRDPDVEIVIDVENETAHAMTFTQHPRIFQEVEQGDENGRLGRELNNFLSGWLDNINAQDYLPSIAHEAVLVEGFDNKIYFGDNGKEYQLGMGHMGNGLTVWNRLEEKDGDYVKIAHIGADRSVTYYDDNLPNTVKTLIEIDARETEITISASQDTPVFDTPPQSESLETYSQVGNTLESSTEQANQPEPQGIPIVLPDLKISLSERDSFGYTYPDMLPLTLERALELYDANMTVYMLYEDNTEAMVFERDEIIADHAGIFGVEREDWEKSTEYMRMAAENSETTRESALIHSDNDSFGIYQLKDGEELRYHRFASLAQLEKDTLSIERGNYELVYTAPLQNRDTLDDIYEKFNIDHPADFHGHSLSVSDVVVLQQGGAVSSHYVDNFGFAELPVFLGNETQRETTAPLQEQTVTQDASGPAVAELEAQVKAGGQISLLNLARAVKSDAQPVVQTSLSEMMGIKKEKPSILAQLQEARKTAAHGQEQPKNEPKRNNEREV